MRVEGFSTENVSFGVGLRNAAKHSLVKFLYIQIIKLHDMKCGP